VIAAWVQRNAPAELALALIVYAAGARLPLRIGVAVASSVTLAVDVTILSDAHVATNVIATTLLATLLFLVAVLVRRSRADQNRAELLSAQLADSLELREHAARVEARGRIARDLHDVLAHSLSGLAIQLEGARVLARRQQANTELMAALERAATLTRAGTDEARQAVAALRGDAVPGTDRLRQLLADFSTDTGIPAELTIEGSPTVLPAEAAGALYRACQEALTNVARHSGSQRARLRLSYQADTATLTVTDHRDGLEQRRALLPDVGSGYGLNAMRERITLLGGTLTAGPTGDGWKVEITIPR
jgi:signal transduction histidine kinase